MPLANLVKEHLIMDTIGGTVIVDVLVFAVFVVARVIAAVAVVVATCFLFASISSST